MRLPYRRRRARIVPFVLGLAAVLLLGIGSAIVFVSLSGVFEPTATLPPTNTPTTAPTWTATITSTITETAGPSPTPTERPVFTYTVEAGDSLFSVAEKFDLTIEQLVAANSIGCTGLQVGATLTIPPPNYEVPTPTPLPTGIAKNARLFHVVRPGETLIGIASAYQTTVEKILEYNGDIISDPNNLPVCAQLEIRFGWALWTPTLPGFTPTPTATGTAPATATATATRSP